jgi:DNA-binding NtrC family response regulator
MMSNMPYESRNGILVVDDDQSQLTTMRDLLEMENYEPVCCSSASVAMEAVREQHLDVAILDLKMPDIDGIQLMKQLKAENSEIKVIINTAYSSVESAMDAVNAHAFAYIEKMGDVGVLLDQVQRAFQERLLDNEMQHRQREEQLNKLKAKNAKLEQEVEKLRLEVKRLDKKSTEIQKNPYTTPTLGMQRICSSCQKIKDESGRWLSYAEFVQLHKDTDLVRGFCLTCGQDMLESMKKKFRG